MNHANKNLYQIGEVTKMLGVTRRMLLNYEDLGLLTPAYKNESSGFRYYSADNIVHIRIIKVLQRLGLSLSEINKYFNNTEKLDDVIERMTTLRSQLDLCIAQLQLRQSQTSEPEIRFITLPSFTAFCQEFKDSDLARKTEDLRKTFIEATKKYQLDTTAKKVITKCEIFVHCYYLCTAIISHHLKAPIILLNSSNSTSFTPPALNTKPTAIKATTKKPISLENSRLKPK